MYYSTNETFSNNIKVNDLVTLTVTFILKIANFDQGHLCFIFPNSCLSQALVFEIILFHKHILGLCMIDMFTGRVLDGNQQAAELLASVVHETVNVDPGPSLKQLQDLDIDVGDIGVWIDPIGEIN